MLQRGDAVPHFRVTDLQGKGVAYSTIWQRRILVLVTLPAADEDGSFERYRSDLAADIQASSTTDVACVITRDAVAGTACPGVVVADRWGEIVHVAGGPQSAALPSVGEVMEWIDYVQRQCPECQGETR